MKDKRFVFGVVLTAMWLGVMVAFMCLMPLPDGLNEWGDFFAGFFSPVAFLWLVVGYLQQGEELRNSNAALKLQADELKASVQQQIEMVRISGQQLQHQVDVFKAEQADKRLSVMPKFSFRAIYLDRPKIPAPNQVVIGNYGCSIKAFEYVVTQGQKIVAESRMPFFNEGEEHAIVEMETGESVELAVSYFNGDGEQRLEFYELTCSAPGILVYVQSKQK